MENHEQISRILLEFIERQCVLKEKCHMWRRACGVAVLAQCMASVFIICIGFYYFYRASERSIMMVTLIMSSVVWSLLQAFFYCFYGTEIKTKVRRGG